MRRMRARKRGSVGAFVVAALLVASCISQGEETVKLPERKNAVAMKGNPLTLLGRAVKAGDSAPDFRVVDGAFQPVRLSDFRGKVVLISAVPSIDTGVCSAQTKRFNDEAAKLPGDVVMLTISMDLPFAQKRFCEAEKVARIRVLSDHVWRDFGAAYGVLIKDMGLLARSVFVVDRAGKVIYEQVVRELTTHPDYDAALAAVQKAAG